MNNFWDDDLSIVIIKMSIRLGTYVHAVGQMNVVRVEGRSEGGGRL